MPPRLRIPRRTCLKGLGVAMALPLLEAMGWADPPRGAAGKRPVRLAFFYTPYGYGRTGIKDESFWPKDEKSFAPTGVLPPTLEPLRPVISECMLLGNLSNLRADRENGIAGHVTEAAGFLTCAPMAFEKDKRGTVNIGISADQVAAQQLGAYTTLPSLELAVSACNLSGLTEQGLAAAYHNTISYRSATQPLPADNSPRSVLGRLFSTRKSVPRKAAAPGADTSRFAAGGGGADDGQSLDQSMLDVVMDSTADLRRHISGADQQTLDGYLDSVRSLEKRVAAIERQQLEAARAKAVGGRARAGKFSDPITVTPPAGEAPTRGERVRLMADLMILAFQTDLTRVVTLPFAHPYDGSTFPELGFLEDYHACSHLDADTSKVLKIEQFHIRQFAYIIQRMRGLLDGGGTLLDNSILLFGSGMQNNSHNTYTNLPVLLAGRGGGTIAPGRYLQSKGTMADLLTALLARAGCTLEKPFANGTKLFPELS